MMIEFFTLRNEFLFILKGRYVIFYMFRACFECIQLYDMFSQDNVNVISEKDNYIKGVCPESGIQ